MIVVSTAILCKLTRRILTDYAMHMVKQMEKYLHALMVIFFRTGYGETQIVRESLQKH